MKIINNNGESKICKNIIIVKAYVYMGQRRALGFLHASYWPFGIQIRYDLLALFNKLHLIRRNYNDKLHRLSSHQKKQTNHAWFQQIWLCKTWLKKRLQEMFHFHDDTAGQEYCIPDFWFCPHNVIAILPKESIYILVTN